MRPVNPSRELRHTSSRPYGLEMHTPVIPWPRPFPRPKIADSAGRDAMTNATLAKDDCEKGQRTATYPESERYTVSHIGPETTTHPDRGHAACARTTRDCMQFATTKNRSLTELQVRWGGERPSRKNRFFFHSRPGWQDSTPAQTAQLSGRVRGRCLSRGTLGC